MDSISVQNIIQMGKHRMRLRLRIRDNFLSTTSTLLRASERGEGTSHQAIHHNNRSYIFYHSLPRLDTYARIKEIRILIDQLSRLPPELVGATCERLGQKTPLVFRRHGKSWKSLVTPATACSSARFPLSGLNCSITLSLLSARC